MKLLTISVCAAVLLGLGWLVSYATKSPIPDCADVPALEAFSPQLGHGYWLNPESLEKLRQTLKGLNDGSCRLPAKRSQGVLM